MTFKAKMDDSEIDVDLSPTELEDILQYCKPKEQLILLKKFGLHGQGTSSLQAIGDEY